MATEWVVTDHQILSPKNIGSQLNQLATRVPLYLSMKLLQI